MKLKKQYLNRGCVMFIRSQRSYVNKRTCMHDNKRKTGQIFESDPIIAADILYPLF